MQSIEGGIEEERRPGAEKVTRGGIDIVISAYYHAPTRHEGSDRMRI